jgi:hypothetical protein
MNAIQFFALTYTGCAGVALLTLAFVLGVLS